MIDKFPLPLRLRLVSLHSGSLRNNVITHQHKLFKTTLISLFTTEIHAGNISLATQIRVAKATAIRCMPHRQVCT